MATMPYGIYNLKSFKRLSIGQINCMNEYKFLILFCTFILFRHNFKNFNSPNEIDKMLTFIKYEA